MSIEPPTAPELDTEILLEAVSTVFESLGRAVVCLDSDFRAVHASPGLDALVGEGAAAALRGQPAARIFGPELFGPGGTLRRALETGDRREGWGATMRTPAARPRLVSVSGAPMIHHPGSPCDPRVAYIIAVRPADETDESGSESPTIFSGLVARAPSMLQIFRLIEQLHESEATVLVTGESGTGKELVARAVHIHSPRSQGPFVAVNCGAIPGELLESELFGHVRGAFTGAVQDRIGRFEAASGGTIFLDEVGDLPLHLQVKLLRVLQERTFERVGETRTRDADARVIAATNKDLRQAVTDGSFRDDLYYRLRVVPIAIPPLRYRREDIEPLSRHLLTRVSRRHGRELQLAPEALRAMLHYEWPGNVRELENALEYAVAVNSGQTITATDLPREIWDPETSARLRLPQLGADDAEAPVALPEPVPQDERSRIEASLQTHQWKRGPAAEALGMSRTTLWRKMREYGLIG